MGTGSVVEKKELIEMQENDPTLENLRTKWGFNTRKDSEGTLEVQDGVLSLQILQTRKGASQVMVTQMLREHMMSGQLGVLKSTYKITSNLHVSWPRVHSDVSRYCKSCDIFVQKTIPKGKVTRVPVEQMPLIDTPFKKKRWLYLSTK